MPTLVTTLGSATANSFATREEADAYCDARLYATAWSEASEVEQDRALIHATAVLSGLPWQGIRVNDTQALSWPRYYVINPDRDWPVDRTLPAYPVYYLETEIPQRLKDATIELALGLLVAGDDVWGDQADLGVQSEQVGPMRRDYAVGRRPVGLQRFPRVLARIGPLLRSSQTQVVRA